MFRLHSFVILCFCWLLILGLCEIVRSCENNNNCRNGYCKSNICICNPGWWGIHCQYCRLRLTADSGLITDGDGAYATSSKCAWLIETQRENSTIILDFEEFATECNWDHLYVYDGKSVQSPLVGVISGLIRDETKSQYAAGPLLKLQARSGAALLYFYSDKHYVEDGFQIKYRVSQDCSAKCNFHGICNEHNNCSCDPGWAGLDCSIQTCVQQCVHGHCDSNTRLCVCQPGFTGASCNATGNRGNWIRYASIGQDMVHGRASHAAVVLGDFIWVFGGFSLIPEPFQDFVRYHIPSDSWEVVPVVNASAGPAGRYGHSMVAYNSSLIMFGGRINKKATNELWSFDTQTLVWQSLIGPGDVPLAVAGHTATVARSKMIVLFGYGPEEGYTNKVQEYDIETGKWALFDVRSDAVNAAYGPSSVYDPTQGLIYVHGGFVSHSSHKGPSNATSAYNPWSRAWYTLKSNKVPRFLHSAVIVDNLMLVFGGDSHNDTESSRSNLPCYSLDFVAYDISCNEWKQITKSGIPKTSMRYGHAAVLVNRTMYIFGGFQGVMLNDMLSFTPGPCTLVSDRNNCELQYNSSGCVWSESSSSCRGPEHCTRQQNHDYAKCSEFSTCVQCTSSLHTCLWCGDHCAKTENCLNKGTIFSPDKCPEKKEGKRSYPVCHNKTACKDCVADQRCIWCESQQQCLANDAYPVNFPYGQCRGWVQRLGSACSAERCSGMKTCDDCHTLPGCGWCDDGSATGLGKCMKGGDDGPFSDSTKNILKCPLDRWYFVECPDCQCNGHSKCINKNICYKCDHQTDGPYCEKCAFGYFGDAKNGGTCKACKCNDQAVTCDPESGICECLDRWVTGDHCERCVSRSDVLGNATNGGYCYNRLDSNLKFTFNVSNKTSINFLYIPEEDDIDVEFSIAVKSGEFAVLNLTIGSETMADVAVVTLQEIGSYEETFSHEDYKFGGNDKFAFKVYIFDVKGFTILEISFLQHRTFVILKFFITFFGCFFSLLLVVALAWKIKVRYSNFVMSRQRLRGMKLMARRPFSKVCLNVTDPLEEGNKATPSVIAVQPCENNAATVAVFMMRLPRTENGLAPFGQSNICCATILGSHAEAGVRRHLSRTVQRRPGKSSSFPKPCCI